MTKGNIKIIFLIFIIVILFSLFHVLLPNLFKKEISFGELASGFSNLATTSGPSIDIKKVVHLPTPEFVKAIYMTACIASTKDAKNDLVDLIDETEINSIVIDIKNDTGTISFNSDNPKLLGVNGPGCKVKDLAEFINLLHTKNIYVIGRISVFQDPYYTKIRPELAVQNKETGEVWKDFKGNGFIDVGAEEYWDYIVELAIESYEIGFDEINFDYVRFPSDGSLKTAYFPFSQSEMDKEPATAKSNQLEKFFKYLDKELSESSMIISADLFGLVTTADDDLGIGQVLEKALPYFDYIAPMVYPSHFDTGFNGWADPNKVPYDVIHFSMQTAIKKLETLKNDLNLKEEIRNKIHKNQLRPWLQDFDYGGDYGKEEVLAQIQATYDVGLNSWMLWSPSNRYTREALKDE